MAQEWSRKADLATLADLAILLPPPALSPTFKPQLAAEQTAYRSRPVQHTVGIRWKVAGSPVDGNPVGTRRRPSRRPVGRVGCDAPWGVPVRARRRWECLLQPETLGAAGIVSCSRRHSAPLGRAGS